MDAMQSRIFDEIDQQGRRVEELSKITYANSATLGILSKLVILIMGFLIVAGVTASYNIVSTKILKDAKQNHYRMGDVRSVGPAIEGGSENAD